MYSFVWLFTSGNGRGVSGGSGCSSDSVAHGSGDTGDNGVSLGSGNSNSSPSLKQTHLLMEPSS